MGHWCDCEQFFCACDDELCRLECNRCSIYPHMAKDQLGLFDADELGLDPEEDCDA